MTLAPHISIAVSRVLQDRGFRRDSDSTYVATLNGAGQAGAFVIDGTRLVRLRICSSGRWFERLDGSCNVTRDTDLRDWTDRPGAAVDYMVAPD